MIYTFYSFKGGVGRSMALANVAEILYERGLDVLMIDFDLEAPGLERYFSEPMSAHTADEVASKRGLIDLFNSYKELRSLPRTQTPPAVRFGAAAAEGDDEPFPYPVEPLTNFVVPIYKKSTGGGSLSLITAGRRAGKEFTRYAQQVREFDWNDFHVRWDGERFFEWFRREAEKIAPVVLVDSRTGVTEMGGVCIYQLADVVLMFVATNQQNIGGTASIARSLSNERLISHGRKGRPLSAVFVPSRVENAEKHLLDTFAERFNEIFGGMTAHALDDGRNLFNELKIPYVAYFSFMESVAAREPNSASAQPLVGAFDNIIHALARVEPEGGPLRESYFPSERKGPKAARIFISYRRGIEPEDTVASRIREGLTREGHHVFTAETMPVGTRWAEHIDAELRGADYFVTLLSEKSVHSEMIVSEVEKAHRLSRAQGGKLVILPVRLNYTEPFHYDLAPYLNAINWALWKGEQDTDKLVEELKSAVEGVKLKDALPYAVEESTRSALPVKTSATPVALEVPGGVVPLDSPLYLEREVDRRALAALAGGGATLVIQGPRQVGKSSILVRALRAAEREGQRVALLDFQLLDKATLSDSSIFFRAFCSWITDSLGLEDRVEEFWRLPLGGSHLCARYIERHVLPSVAGPLVLAMDEVDVLTATDYSGNFFSMLRSWHNCRAVSSEWRHLSLVLVISRQPYELIGGSELSPFNVGTIIEPSDFNTEEVAELNRRHGSPLTSHEVRQLVELTGGQPYLTRRALYLIAAAEMSFAKLLESAADERGPFGDHLRRHLFRIHDKPELLEALREVIKKGECSDEHALYRLSAAGLVLRRGKSVSTRGRLYERYFRQALGV